MKKILALLLVLTLCLPAFSYTKREERKGEELLIQMQKTKSIDDLNKALDYGLKLSKKYNEPISETFLNAINSAVKMNADRYKTVSDKKYIKNVLKYTDIAIEKGSKDSEAIIIGIVFAQLCKNTNLMVKYYDYLSIIDPKGANEMKETFSNQIVQVQQIKSAQKAAVARFILTGQF